VRWYALSRHQNVSILDVSCMLENATKHGLVPAAHSGLGRASCTCNAAPASTAPWRPCYAYPTASLRMTPLHNCRSEVARRAGLVVSAAGPGHHDPHCDYFNEAGWQSQSNGRHHQQYQQSVSRSSVTPRATLVDSALQILSHVTSDIPSIRHRHRRTRRERPTPSPHNHERGRMDHAPVAATAVACPPPSLRTRCRRA
jgi:hypothetical protein